MTVLTSTGQFAVFTYVAPMLHDGVGASAALVTIALIVVGLGMTVGNHFGGIAADKSLRGTLIGTLVVLIVLLGASSVLHTNLVAMLMLLFMWGGLCFTLVPTMQMRVMGAAQDAPSLASSVNIGAFNLGN